MEAGPLRFNLNLNGSRSNADRRRSRFDCALVILSVAALIGLLAAGCGDDQEVKGTIAVGKPM